jgi:uncharacterized protein YkwD
VRCPAGPLLLLLLCQAAHADPTAAANWSRLHGCDASGLHPLRASASLQKAAQRVAAGDSLQHALAALRDVRERSSLLHLSGAVADSDVARLLSRGSCTTLADARLQEIGSYRRGREVWLVVATTTSIPSADDAARLRQQVVELVNAARVQGRRCGRKSYAPAPGLHLNAALAAAALEHARDMAVHDEFEHRGHDGSTPGTRVQQAAYGPYRVVGENIAAGAMTAAEVVQGWLDSPAHCENIMDPRFTDIGIAYAVNLDSRSGIYWTQDFAAPR